MIEKKSCGCLEIWDEHQEENECKLCGRCVWNEPSIKSQYDSYEEQGICLDCAMNKEGVSLAEIVAIFNQN